MASVKVYGDHPHFCGQQISDYGIKYGYVDYRALGNSFDAVLNNYIIQRDPTGWEQISGFIDHSEEIEEIEDRIENNDYDMTLWSDMRDEIEERMNDLTNEEDRTMYNEWLIEFLGGRHGEYDRIVIALEDENNSLEDQIEELRNDEMYLPEVYQWYIVSDQGADILQRHTNEILYYNEDIDMYLWGVTHFGTSWDYVLTDIQIERA